VNSAVATSIYDLCSTRAKEQGEHGSPRGDVTLSDTQADGPDGQALTPDTLRCVAEWRATYSCIAHIGISSLRFDRSTRSLAAYEPQRVCGAVV